MTTFIATRHGSNAANQSMTDSMIVGTIEADSVEEAHELAAEKWTVYANQHFSFETWEEADSEACNEASEADRALAEHDKYFSDI